MATKKHVLKDKELSSEFKNFLEEMGAFPAFENWTDQRGYTLEQFRMGEND